MRSTSNFLRWLSASSPSLLRRSTAHPSRETASSLSAFSNFGSALRREKFAPALGADGAVHQSARCRRREMRARAAALAVVRAVLVPGRGFWNLRRLAVCANREQRSGNSATADDDPAAGKCSRRNVAICGCGHWAPGLRASLFARKNACEDSLFRCDKSLTP